jgi:two-component system, NarL family, sensor histidine kinase DesK
MTNVTKNAHCAVRNSASAAMKDAEVRVLGKLRKPTEDGAPAWGGLLWALPLAYVFVDPYRRQAGWVEWLVTALALGAFLVLYTLGLIFWRRKDVLRFQCAAATVLAIAFMAYRPSGAIFFPVIAAFVPFSVNGRIAASATLVALIVLACAVEWLLLGRTLEPFLYVVLFQSLILGAGTTFIARQMLANDRLSRHAERERIARDLHDTLGHTLTAIAVKAELAGQLLERNAAAARSEISDIERISRETLAEAREVIHDYHAGGLKAELARATSMLEAAGVGVDQDCDADVSPAQERVLGLVLRESVTNIVRHAQATRCRLALRRIGDTIRMIVEDNGRGGAHPEGLGMQSIKARVDALGGSAVWSGDSGTLVTITLPTKP